jgi:hypothetical protein
MNVIINSLANDPQPGCFVSKPRASKTRALFRLHEEDVALVQDNDGAIFESDGEYEPTQMNTTTSSDSYSSDMDVEVSDNDSPISWEEGDLGDDNIVESCSDDDNDNILV